MDVSKLNSDDLNQKLQQASKPSIIWNGDTSLPWFDPKWPYNGPRLQRYEGRTKPIDMEELIPVAGFAGSGLTHGELVLGPGETSPFKLKYVKRQRSRIKCKTESTFHLSDRMLPSVQKLLAVLDREWIIISNCASAKLFIPYMAGHLVNLNFEDNEEVTRAFTRIGKEGLLVDKQVDYIDLDGNKKLIRFEGDETLRRVVELLNNWGWMESPNWPTIVGNFPQLNTMNDYLLRRKLLYASGVPAEKNNTNFQSGNNPDIPLAPQYHDGVDRETESFRWLGELYYDLSDEVLKVLEELVKNNTQGRPTPKRTLIKMTSQSSIPKIFRRGDAQRILSILIISHNSVMLPKS
jgi:hypothetical protein